MDMGQEMEARHSSLSQQEFVLTWRHYSPWTRRQLPLGMTSNVSSLVEYLNSCCLQRHLEFTSKRKLSLHCWGKASNRNSRWKWRNDRRIDRNLCSCVKKLEKYSGLQRGLNPWHRDTGVMLYQLSYEATDVGSRSIVGSNVPEGEMSVNDIWNKSYMNWGNEMKKWKIAFTAKIISSFSFHFPSSYNHIMIYFIYH